MTVMKLKTQSTN